MYVSGKYLVTTPSLSPENSFLDEKNEQGVYCEGSTIDIQIVHTILSDFAKTTQTLGLEDTLLSEVHRVQSRLPPMKTGSFGQLQEWPVDYGEVEPGHRHVSHLWALYPGRTITPEKTPDLAKACDITICRREAHGDGHAGWSRAWLITLQARLFASEECAKHLEALLAHSTLLNLLDNHPPFQIDGNFGGVAGILEMLIQSHEVGTIKLLPVCPTTWYSGALTGVKAHGGFELEFSWEDGHIVGFVIVHSTLGNDIVICFPNGGPQVSIRGKGTHRVAAPTEHI
jgi:hypothetical protein